MAALALFFVPLVVSLAVPGMDCQRHAPGFYVLRPFSTERFETFETAAASIASTGGMHQLWFCSGDPMED